MLNNPALDVAIGLVFIYAIYSLLATTITELFASWIGLRGRNLKRGIKRMLDDNLFNTEFPNKLSETFIGRPEIKLLGKGKGKKVKEDFPSYIKSKTFAKGLINSLEDVHHFNKDLNKLKESLKESKTPTSIFIVNLIDEANSNVERFKSLIEDWFNETMDRVGGWYRRHINLITFIAGFLIAITLNVDTISISKKLSQDKKARLAMVEAASGYVKSFEAIDSLSEDEYERITQLNNRVDSLLVQDEIIGTIIEWNPPKNFGLFRENQNRSESWPFILKYILGCLITAIALSLGSSFWFDLLSKLIKLRGAGTQEKTNLNVSKSNPVG